MRTLLVACLVATTRSEPRKRLRGAVREIGDVQDELGRLERSEQRVTRLQRDESKQNNVQSRKQCH